MKKPVNFYSEGARLVGDVYYPDNARVLTEHGYVALTFVWTYLPVR